MMTTLDSAMVFAVLAALCTSGSFVAVIAGHRRLDRLRARCHLMEASVATLQREIERMAALSANTGSRVNRIENDYSGVAGRVDQVEMRGTAQSFDMAIDFARRGADVSELTQRFGLSRGEAELVARMHGVKKSA